MSPGGTAVDSDFHRASGFLQNPREMKIRLPYIRKLFGGRDVQPGSRSTRQYIRGCSILHESVEMPGTRPRAPPPP